MSSARSRGGCYLLTWTTYGTWLPGDPKGFVGRVPTAFGEAVHNRVGMPHDRDMPRLREDARARMKGDPVALSRAAANTCLRALLEVASAEGVDLIIAAIMPTHVHLVVRSRTLEGQELLRRFKGVSSRRLSQTIAKPSGRWWTQHGSRRLLTNNESVQAAIQYVATQKNALVFWKWDEAQEAISDRAD